MKNDSNFSKAGLFMYINMLLGMILSIVGVLIIIYPQIKLSLNIWKLIFICDVVLVLNIVYFCELWNKGE